MEEEVGGHGYRTGRPRDIGTKRRERADITKNQKIISKKDCYSLKNPGKGNRGKGRLRKKKATQRLVVKDWQKLGV